MALHRCFSKNFGEAVVQVTLILQLLLECLKPAKVLSRILESHHDPLSDARYEEEVFLQ